MIRLHDLLRSPPIITALIIGVALRVVLALVTPVGGASEAGRLSSYNDEIAHLSYVRHVLESGRLPEQAESIQAQGALERGAFENYQPPLYYAVVAAICRLAGQRDLAELALVGRLTALVCSLMLLWILLRIATELSLEPERVAAAVVFWALNGVMVRFASTAGNDALFWVCAGGMILTALRMERSDSGLRDFLSFGAFAVAALYTKLSALILLPLPFLALGHNRRGRWFMQCVVMMLLILAAAGTVWWRNVHSFGSLLPLDSGFGAAHWRVPDLLSVGYAIRSFFFPWHELWRAAIGLTLMAPLMLIACAGVVSRTQWHALWRAPVLLVALILTFIAYLGLNLRYDQAEARYLFAAWPALAVLLSLPLRTQAARWVLVVASLLPYALMLLPSVAS